MLLWEQMDLQLLILTFNPLKRNKSCSSLNTSRDGTLARNVDDTVNLGARLDPELFEELVVSILLFLVAWIQPAADVYTVEVEDQVGGLEAPFPGVRGMLYHSENLFVMSVDQQLWSVQPTDGDAQLVDDRPGAAYISMYEQGAQFVVLDQNGFQRKTYDATGKLLGSAITKDQVLYANGSFLLRLDEPNSPQHQPLKLIWNRGDQELHYNLTGDVPANPRQISTALVGSNLLIVCARRDAIDYALLDIDTGQIKHSGTRPWLDTRRGEHATSISLTAHPTYGFALTEHTVSGEFRMLHLLAPGDSTWSSQRLNLPDGLDLAFCQRLTDQLWLAQSGTSLMRFRLQANTSEN